MSMRCATTLAALTIALPLIYAVQCSLWSKFTVIVTFRCLCARIEDHKSTELIDLRFYFYVPLDAKRVISETFFPTNLLA